MWQTAMYAGTGEAGRQETEDIFKDGITDEQFHKKEVVIARTRGNRSAEQSVG
jgi:hypothetical protein